MGSVTRVLGRTMYIAARLALCATASAPGVGFHGSDIVVRALSPTGFQAESRAAHTIGEIVRLRLPGAGAMLARIDEAGEGRLSASFLNPVGNSRLGMTLGMARATG
jgi:hypothetical protein